jgi:hypothetical protein
MHIQHCEVPTELVSISAHNPRPRSWHARAIICRVPEIIDSPGELWNYGTREELYSSIRVAGMVQSGEEVMIRDEVQALRGGVGK